MKNFFLYVTIAAFAMFGRCSCDKNNPAASTDSPTGAIEAKVIIWNVGSLNKTKAISLVKGYLQLSSAGENVRLDSFALAGNSQITIDKIFSDLKVKTWSAKAWSIDSKGMVIHSDSTTFTVIENDTVDVPLSLSAKYEQMPMYIHPISDSAKRVVVAVNGVNVIDTTFGKNSGIDTLKLNYDYLLASPGGTVNSISMKIYGDWIDSDTLLWTGQDTVLVKSGVDIKKVIPLAWVGPQIGGVDISIIFGFIGTTSVYGTVQPRPNSGGVQ
jgi:hypothetical protein